MLSAAGPQATATGVSLSGEFGEITGEVAPSHSRVQSQADTSGALCPAPMLTSLQSQDIELVCFSGWEKIHSV